MDRYSFNREEVHASGGFAKVIRGRDNELERDVAVKVLNPRGASFSDSDRQRFRREAKVLARLSHPNIPAIYDVEFEPESLIIIFQFVDGKTLKEMTEQEGACHISQARIWFNPILSALDHAHALGIVHRDVKPANIIITPSRETAYLVDFGIALSRDEARLTKPGYAIGTPGYMSPEQHRGEPLDLRTDLYSLAVTLYETLAGKRMSIGNYEELSLINEAIPPEIDELIQKSLVSKEKRIGSAKEFLAGLMSALKPSKPLSEVLAHGRLHELSSAVEELTPTAFIKLPKGQRLLILNKVLDIVTSGDPQLTVASEQLLGLLLTRGVFLPKGEYRGLLSPAMMWGFEKKLGGFIGSKTIRSALVNVSQLGRGDANEVLAEELLIYLDSIELDKKEDWYFHNMRDLLSCLLANPSCGATAGHLAEKLTAVNTLQRRKNASA